MSRDLILGRTNRNFAIGSLPEGAEGYAPTKWIKVDEAETLIAKLMNPPGFFASKLTREQAERKLLAELRAKKVGIMSGNPRETERLSRSHGLAERVGNFPKTLTTTGLDLGLMILNRLRNRPDDAPLLDAGSPPLQLEFSAAERRALKLLEPSTAAFVVNVLSWARSQGIPARLSTQAVIYTLADSARHYAEGRSAVAPGQLGWHNVGRAFHLVIKNEKGQLDRDAYTRVGQYVRQHGGEWLGNRTIITTRGPIQDFAHYEYHPGINIVSYRKSTLAAAEFQKAQSRAKKYG